MSLAWKKKKKRKPYPSRDGLFYQVALKNVKQPRLREPGTFQDCEMVSAPSAVTKCPTRWAPPDLWCRTAYLCSTKPPKLLTNQTMGLKHWQRTQRKSFLKWPCRSWHDCLWLLHVKGTGGRGRWDCLISIVWERLWTLKRVSCVLKALGLYTFTKIKKKNLKKAQLVTGWSGFSIHLKEMTYIIFFYYESKKALPTYSQVSYTYIGHMLLWRYICLHALHMQTLLLYIVSIYMFLIAEEHNYICQFHTKSWRQRSFELFFSSNSQHPPVLHFKTKKLRNY